MNEQSAPAVKGDNPIRPRVIFFGTPAFALTCLQALVDAADVALVVTQPDRGSGRGLKVSVSPVKAFAQAKGIEVIQPLKVRTPEFAETLRRVNADIGVVVAYGRILPPAVLGAPRLGCVNIHASLLPKYRGAAPIEWSIINGETETGVCLMQLDEGMDTGPVFARLRCAIDSDETADELSSKLAALGAQLLVSRLGPLVRGELVAEPQDHQQATVAPIMRKEDGAIDWAQPARRIHNRVRGVNPWPGAFTYLEGKRVIVHRTRVLQETERGAEPGTVVRVSAAGIEVGGSEGVVAIEEIQAEGKRKMPAAQFVAGHRIKSGIRFSSAAEKT